MPRSPRNLFTVEQADAVLPLVQVIVADIVRLSAAVELRRPHLTAARSEWPESGGVDLYGDELRDAEVALEREMARLRECEEELASLGVTLTGATEGLVGFSTEVDGRAAYWCWRLGEPEVGHWHFRDEEFANRKSLATLAGK